MKRPRPVGFVLLLALVPGPVGPVVYAEEPPALEGPGVAGPESVVPPSTGPASLHEAIVPPSSERDPARVASSPPAPVVERPGASPPGPTAQWVEGYWEWDERSKDFVWVTGAWRIPPPGQFWVNGFWRRDDRGWYRVPGFWSTRRATSSTPAGRTETARTVATAAATTHTVARPPFSDADRPADAASAPVPTGPAPTALTLSVPATAPAAVVPSEVVGLAEQLAGQAAAFERVFGMTARVTPQGGAFLSDSRFLQGAALGLRQAAASGDPAGMALAYRDVYAAWRRMADRINMIAPGRTGPNIQQIWDMGDTTARIGRALP